MGTCLLNSISLLNNGSCTDPGKLDTTLPINGTSYITLFLLKPLKPGVSVWYPQKGHAYLNKPAAFSRVKVIFIVIKLTETPEI